MYFPYGEKETAYLKQKDAALGAIIDKIGHIDRETDDNLFSSVVHNIVGQQISGKALNTIWERMQNMLGEINEHTLLAVSDDELQSVGISFRKVSYIKEFAKKVALGEFDIAAIPEMSDEDAIKALSSLSGVGTWTAEMLLLFCECRMNILSYNDLGIIRGMRMVYHHRKIDKALFEKYRRRLSPYCSVASLYFWAVSGGAIPDMKDPAPKKERIKCTI